MSGVTASPSERRLGVLGALGGEFLALPFAQSPEIMEDCHPEPQAKDLSAAISSRGRVKDPSVAPRRQDDTENFSRKPWVCARDDGIGMHQI